MNRDSARRVMHKDLGAVYRYVHQFIERQIVRNNLDQGFARRVNGRTPVSLLGVVTITDPMSLSRTLMITATLRLFGHTKKSDKDKINK